MTAPSFPGIMNMTPLRWPDSFVPPPPEPPPPEKRSWLRKLWDLFPLRLPTFYPGYATVVPYIEEQLLARGPSDPSRWGDDPLRVRIGQLACKLIQKEYDWPSDHFLPDDPLDVVFHIPWDFRDWVEVAEELSFELRIDGDDVMSMAIEAATLGDMVDMLVAHVQRQSGKR